MFDNHYYGQLTTPDSVLVFKLSLTLAKSIIVREKVILASIPKCTVERIGMVGLIMVLPLASVVRGPGTMFIVNDTNEKALQGWDCTGCRYKSNCSQ